MCADAEAARLLAGDRRLGKICHPAGERLLAFWAEERENVRTSVLDRHERRKTVPSS